MSYKKTRKRKFNELRNKINELKEYFMKEMETIKKNETEILMLKYSINEMQNALESLMIVQII